MATVTRRLAALLGASGAGLTDSATASKITTDSINDDAVNAAKIAANAVGTSEVADNVLTATDLAANSVGESELSVDYTAQSVPHIVPGILFPSDNDKQIDGTTALAASTTGPAGSTVASSKFGTVQSDGRMYYYTDIKGSKPIKDPRIGAYFGSQRYKFTSLQILEQETATHGENVFSIDGREWCRATGPNPDVEHDQQAGAPHSIQFNPSTANDFIEVVGYFNGVNVGFAPLSNSANNINIYINGADTGNDYSSRTVAYSSSFNSPLFISRYVDSGSFLNINVGSLTEPGIYTLKIGATTTYHYVTGIELIAQDLSGSGSPNRSKIKFPAQNVVSFGKKFAISETNHHYNPFAFAENGTTAIAIGNAGSHGKVTGGWSSGGSSTADHYDSTLDTTTSLGLAAWVKGGNYYRPVNGGRIVKWVDSTGVIKTSVNVMPPSGTANGNQSKSDSADPDAHNWPVTYQPKLSSSTVDYSQSEVAKSYHFREFGNGNANGGPSGTYRDLSHYNGSNQDLAYVMDDGLTHMSYHGAYRTDSIHYLRPENGSDKEGAHITFIGTGFSIEDHDGNVRSAQNLPYGSHIIEFEKPASETTGNNYIDAIKINDDGFNAMMIKDFIYFHQPKRPPIPEDAVVLADYMLMADFVKQSATGSDIRGQISKGSRYVSASRDHLYEADSWGGALSGTENAGSMFGIRVRNNAANPKGKLTFFGTTAAFHIEGSNQGANAVTLGGSATTETALDNSVVSHGDALTIAETVNLGITNTEITFAQNYNLYATAVATPIHTSSHYQTFETPFLRELVGGDRNMEQTNLVCTPDGKTWDEVSRDTSYIGSMIVSVNTDTETQNGTSQSNTVVFDEIRGTTETYRNYFTKDFTIAYDRMICLKDGQYNFSCINYNADATHTYFYVNNNYMVTSYNSGSNSNNNGFSFDMNLKRGDYIQLRGGYGSDGLHYNSFQIKRI